jgi:O-glycosyl hydrolase
LWELNGNENFTYAAFKAFRNYDGAGGEFEDTSVKATSSDVTTATVYASVDSATSKMVILAINKSTTAKTAGIKITHNRSYTSADVYRVTAGGGPAPVAAPSITPVATNAFNYQMPAQSISVIVPK